MTEDIETRTISKTRTRRYIPHLAEFFFQPDHDWSVEEAKVLYGERAVTSGNLPIDQVLYTDCIDGMKRLPAGQIDLVIADPPFGIAFDGRSSAYNRDGELVVEGYEEVIGEYDNFARAWIAELPRLIKDDGSIYIFSGWTNLESVLKGAREAGLTTINHLIWNYPFGVYTKKRFVTSHYHILLLAKSPKDFFFNKHKHYPQDVWSIKREYRAGQAKNGTKLPVEVVQKCIDFSSRPGDIILDPFMGNGTTAAAAKANWRHYIGFELNEQLREVIDEEVQSYEPGEMYSQYSERLPSIEELAKAYPRAHKEYLRLKKEGNDAPSL